MAAAVGRPIRRRCGADRCEGRCVLQNWLLDSDTGVFARYGVRTIKCNSHVDQPRRKGDGENQEWQILAVLGGHPCEEQFQGR